MIALVVVVVALAGLVAGPAVAERRVALVVGNGKYTHEGLLPNPANDARAIAAALKRIKFDDVQVVLDGDLKTLQSALAAFARSADSADLALVYYSGHGIEVDGQNYLLPTDARLAEAADVDFETVSLDLVLRAADRAGRVKMIVLDACRNNPFQARMLQRQGRRSVGRGLAAPPASGTGMLVAYAARAGTTADDGPAGGNSPFTSAFLKFAEQPRVEVRRLLGQVRDEVVGATRRRQEPYTYGSLGGDEVFLNPAGVAAPAAGTSAPSVAPAAAARLSAAAEAWTLTQNTTSIAVLETFIRRFGDTYWGDLAKARLEQLRDERQRLALLQKQEDDRKRAEAAAAERAEAKRKAAEAAASKRDPLLALTPGSGQSARDRLANGQPCAFCPEMLVVPAGEFTMGSNDHDSEKPPHKVVIAKPFAVAKFEVTFAEWDACVDEGKCRHKPETSWGRGRQPVHSVSWNDITKEYLPWLNAKTGKPYRLLTEAEWEYAARAGTTTKYAFGDSISKRQAQFSEGSYGSAKQTVEVGKFPANAWGLHDMHGNVWEWVEDCWQDSYYGAPTDGAARTSGNCSSRVLRGGSWNDNPGFLRAAQRNGSRPGGRDGILGFRLARTLLPTP